MEFLAMMGITGETLKYLIAILGMMGVMEYIKTCCGEFYTYRDPSGMTIVKNRKTGQRYLKSENGHLTEIIEPQENKKS